MKTYSFGENVVCFLKKIKMNYIVSFQFEHPMRWNRLVDLILLPLMKYVRNNALT